MSGARKEKLVTGEIYHVFNKSVAHEEIFTKVKDLKRAVNLLEFYRFPQSLKYSFFKRLNKEAKKEYFLGYRSKNPFVQIYSFAFMPTHFHLLLKQASHKGIEKLLSNFQNSFAKFYNLKYRRPGGLFLKPFRSKRVSKDEEFLHLSRYIHLNPVTAYIIEYKDLRTYPWTSFRHYLGENTNIIDANFILNIAGSRKRYENFVSNQADYQRKLNKIKHLIFE